MFSPPCSTCTATKQQLWTTGCSLSAIQKAADSFASFLLLTEAADSVCWASPAPGASLSMARRAAYPKTCPLPWGSSSQNTARGSPVEGWCLTVRSYNLRIWPATVIYLSGCFTSEWSQILAIPRTTCCQFHSMAGLLLPGCDNGVIRNKSSKRFPCHRPHLPGNPSAWLAALPVVLHCRVAYC